MLLSGRPCAEVNAVNLAVAQSCQSIRSADPQIAIMILQQASNVIAQQLRRIPAVVYGEVDSIESSHTFTSREPEKAIARLQNRTHRILRHSAVCLPCMQVRTGLVFDPDSGHGRCNTPEASRINTTQPGRRISRERNKSATAFGNSPVRRGACAARTGRGVLKPISIERLSLTSI